MLTTISLGQGITLRCIRQSRFKQGCLSLQLLRPMTREEAALNALFPAVLLRGTEKSPDLRAITLRLDDLYGASVGAVVRRLGDYQTTGLICSFIEDAYALEGDRILAPMADFLRELLLEPVMEGQGFSRDFVEGEKTNLISAIDTIRNDKQLYASHQFARLMCREDSLGIPRLGERSDVEAITPEGLYAHYRKVLRECPMELFYVGSQAPETVAELLRPLICSLSRQVQPLPSQTPFHACEPQSQVEPMDVTQSRLCMGYTTPITFRDDRFAAMQLCSTILGGSMSNKLFTVIREQMSLCYDIGSSYNGGKGILSVKAGIDASREETVRREVERQIDACRRGDITEQELSAARQTLISQLRQVPDSPGSLENYYTSSLIGGLNMEPETYMEKLLAVTREDIARAAGTLQLHTVYFLKGEGQ